MKVPFLDLYACHKPLAVTIGEYLRDTIDRSAFVLGNDLESFEKSFASYLGVKYVVGVANGTDALFLSLKVSGIGPGDEVITTPFTFVAPVECILNLGARPVFVDIDRDSYCINADKLENAITSKTKAISPVHLYGHPANMDKTMLIAKKYNLQVIEDSAQAHGSKIKGKMAGTFGRLGCFSMYPTKNLGGFGDGGAIAVTDESDALLIKKLRNHGGIERYKYEHLGVNSRLDSFNARILSLKLTYLDSWNEKRRICANVYENLLKDIPQIITPKSLDGVSHNYHTYVIRSQSRNNLFEHLSNNGIGVQIYYPEPVYLSKAYAVLGHKKGAFPEAEKAADEVLSLPMYPQLSEEQIKYVCGTISAYFNKL